MKVGVCKKRRKKEREINSDKIISRREALSTAAKVAISAVIAGVVAGVGGYFAGSATAPGKTVTVRETKTETVTMGAATTVTTTVTATPKVSKPFQGVKLTMAMFEGPAVTEGFRIHYPKWAERSGAEIEFVTMGFADIYPKIMQDLTSGAGRFDVILYPYDYMGDFAPYLLPLDDYVRKSPELAWRDILRHELRQATWGGKIIAVPYDGDYMGLFYRKDILTNPDYRAEFKKKYGYELPVPPRTLDQLIDVAEFFNGWDVDGDGKVEYGTIVEGTRAADFCLIYYVSNWMAPYAVMPSPPAKYPGIFWFDPETMEPLINSPGHVRGLEKYIEVMKRGCSPGVFEATRSDVLSNITNGNVVLGIDWHDIIMVVESSKEPLKTKHKMGCAITPGSTEYWDRLQQKWVKVEGVHYVPCLSFGGWFMSITKTCKNPDAAFDWIAFTASPEIHGYDITQYYGNAPVRYSEIFNPDVELFKKTGWTEEALWDWLNNQVIPTHLNPNAVLDINIPGMAEYMDAFNVNVERAIKGQLSPKDALDEVASEWEKITEKRGRDKQLKYYRAALGLPTD